MLCPLRKRVEGVLHFHCHSFPYTSKFYKREIYKIKKLFKWNSKDYKLYIQKIKVPKNIQIQLWLQVSIRISEHTCIYKTCRILLVNFTLYKLHRLPNVYIDILTDSYYYYFCPFAAENSQSRRRRTCVIWLSQETPTFLLKIKSKNRFVEYSLQL